jgi:hypothetical protein
MRGPPSIYSVATKECSQEQPKTPQLSFVAEYCMKRFKSKKILDIVGEPVTNSAFPLDYENSFEWCDKHNVFIFFLL